MKTIVLVGGGHSHAIALRHWADNPIPDLRFILLSDYRYTPYSGMLPGYLGGFYTYEETHIDLAKLAKKAEVEFYQDKAIGLDPTGLVYCSQLPPIKFDYLSLDIGSTPAMEAVPGAKEYAIAVKPVPNFLAVWNQLLSQAHNNLHNALNLAIVGGGAGGVEVALNIKHRLSAVLGENLTINIFHRGKTLLPHHNALVSQKLETILKKQKIKLHLNETITQVKPGELICQSGLKVECNPIFWVTQAAAPPWLKASGLTTDSQGFILVSNTLQSVSHPHIFAAGDIATIALHPRPKAGVFAVRQGKPLFDNLIAIAIEKPLKTYIPQKFYLSLIGTGEKTAIASWGSFAWESPLLWAWKDRIDRRFMQQFI